MLPSVVRPSLMLGFASFLSLQAWAGVSVLAVRGTTEDRVKAHCQTAKCEVSILEADAKEFANGNTFVRFKSSVAGQDVHILTPGYLSADQFMELLIKINTAKVEFASSVQIFTEDGKIPRVMGSDKSSFPIMNAGLVYQLLEEAGADTMDRRAIETAGSLHSKRFAQTEKSVVISVGNDTLTKSISTALNAKIVDPLNMIKNRQTDTRVFVVSSAVQNYNENFLKTLAVVFDMRTAGYRVTLVSPYLPYARSDKKDQMGVTVTGRLAANMIEAAGADSVSFVRAHAPQSQGFFTIPSLQIMGRKTINSYLQTAGIELVVAPDAGAQKDDTLYADELKLNIGVINKQRDLQTGESKLKDISGPDVKGKVLAVIDDETASGGTLGKGAEFLKKLGAKKVIAVVTHLAGNAAQALTSEHIDEVVVTDTLPIDVKSPKLKVLSVSDEIAGELKKYVLKGSGPVSCKAVGN